MTVTIEFDLDYPTGCPVLSSALATQLGAVDIFRGELDLLGFTVTSDTVFNLGGAISRILVLDETAAGALNFLTDAAMESALTNIYTGALGVGVPGRAVQSSINVT